MGFWKALDEILPGTKYQRCWVNKTANDLNRFPKSMHPAVKADLREIWQAQTLLKKSQRSIAFIRRAFCGPGMGKLARSVAQAVAS